MASTATIGAGVAPHFFASTPAHIASYGTLTMTIGAIKIAPTAAIDALLTLFAIGAVATGLTIDAS